MAEDIVVIANPSMPPLSRQQITAIYLGRNLTMRPLDQSTRSTVFDLFYRRLTLREPSYARTIWAGIVFTGHGQPPKVLPSSESIVRQVASEPGTIGYVEKRFVNSSVKELLILP
jgi:ABC-type phosphate transport system substrate-binding protein